MLALAALLADPTPREAAVAQVALERSAQLERNPLSRPQALRLARAVLAAADHWLLEPATLLAIIEVESAYGMGERSTARCRGYMQLNPRHLPSFRRLAGLARGQINDVEDNVFMGASYYRYLFDRYGRHPWAASAYNRGEGLFERQGRPVGRYARRVAARVPVLRELLRAYAREPEVP